MTNSHDAQEVTVNNERSLNKLSRSITNSLGNFALILVRCNYSSLQNQMVKRLKKSCKAEIREIHLSPSVKTLYTSIQAELRDEQPQALMIFGLEQVEQSEQVLVSANQVREEFRKNFPFPLVLWINDEILHKLTRFAPDLKSWAAISIKFEILPDELIKTIKETVDSAFAAILNIGVGKFLNIASLLGDRSFVELEPALNDLKESTEGELTLELIAGLQFLIGREADIKGEKMQARQAYEESLSFWHTKVQEKNPSSEDWSRYGCILFHLGLWYRQYASQHYAEYDSACQQAKEYYQRAMAAFEQSDRAELSANFIDALGEVLMRLKQWDELETVAQTAISLHQTYPEPTRLAYAYGLQAELALHKSDWNNAKYYAELALKTINEPSTSGIDWEWDRQHYRNLYLLLLGQAQQHLNQIAEAISHLEAAKAGSNSQHDPILYIRILAALRSLKFEQGNYLEAFEIKQEQRSIEQQYGLRAFVGAGRLEARHQIANPAIAPADQQLAVNQEIAASGRSQDVKRLIERISRADHKLTVIYGQSGVGKSSLVQAGLLPALKQQAIEARDVLPVLLQVYSDWAKNLGIRFTQSFEEVRGLSLPVLLGSMAEFLVELRRSADQNLLTVFIFDQFEEFFFAYKDATQRKPFFEFLRNCLNIPYVKVILSLREDYLHYLLECNRLYNLDAIDNNILDKKILYYLGNFSPADAKSVIRSLTDNSQFYLQPELIDVLVQDLAGELGEVRPIELQVVGMQLQTEKITTLAQYQERGPKEKLVGHFLSEVVGDCGAENEQFAKIILYLLTDENNTRPLKTIAELKADLALEEKRLDLILKILVKSGLVFLIPGFPAERYQLVHDYLVPFIRQQQSAGLIAELEKEKEQRKLTEAKLNQVLRQQLKTASRAALTLGALVTAVGGFAFLATLVGVNMYVANLSLNSAQENGLERMASALRVGKKLQQLIGIIPDVQRGTIGELAKAVYGIREVNRLEGHTGSVTSIKFSPDGQLIASVSEDKTAKIWKIDGTLLATLNTQTGSITSVRFSPDSQLIASTGKDKMVRLWKTDGTLLITLKAHTGTTTSVSFSPDGKTLASAGEDREVKLWKLDGTLLRTIKGHISAIINVSFSPDGKLLASVDKNGLVKLWNSEDKQIASIENYGAADISFRADSQMLILNNRNGLTKFYSLDGTLVKTVSPYNSGWSSNNLTVTLDGRLIIFDSSYNVGLLFVRNSDGLFIDNRNNFSNFYAHKDEITDLSFSPNGELLASASKDRTIKLWNFDNKTFKQTKDLSDSSNITNIKFSPKGKTIAAAISHNEVQLWNKNKTLLKKFKGDGSILKFSSDGEVIATASAENIVKIWSPNGQEITLKEYSDDITNISLSPDGQLVAFAKDNTSVKLFNRDGTLIQTLTGFNKSIKSINFSPDSQVIAVIGDDNLVKLWRRDGTIIKTLVEHNKSVKSINFSPDSQLIATIGDNNLVNIWYRNGTFIQTLTGHINEVKSINFSPNSQIIASVSQDEIKFWRRDGTPIKTIDNINISSMVFSSDGRSVAVINWNNIVQLWSLEGKLLATLKHNDLVNAVSFSSDGKMIASASDDNTVKLWRIDGTFVKTLQGHEDKVLSVSFSPDSKRLVSVSDDNAVKLWNLNDQEVITLQEPDNSTDISTDEYSGNHVSFSSDGQIIIFVSGFYRASSGRYIYTVKFWNKNGRKIKTFQGRGNLNSFSLNEEREYGWTKKKITIFKSISFSSDRKTIAFANRNNALKLWNTNGVIRGILNSHRNIVNSLSFSKDSTLLASASDDGTVKVWKTDGTLLKTLTHGNKANNVSFSPDDQILASASDDKTVKLWNLDGILIKTLSHKAKVNSVDFRPDGKTLASGSQDGNVTLWSLDGRLINTLNHGNKINIVKFSPNGKVLASASLDGTVKLWTRDGKKFIKSVEGDGSVVDLEFSSDSKILVLKTSYSLTLSFLDGLWFKDTYINPRSQLNAVSLSPDGKSIAIAGNDGISVWSLDLDELLVQGCNLARNYLATNVNVKNDDRRLCDGIGTHK